jgi:hypothetical protein
VGPARDDRRDGNQRRHVVTPGGSQRAQGRAQAKSQQAQPLETGRALQFVGRRVDAIDPGVHAPRVVIVTCRVSRTVIVEPQRRNAGTGRLLAQVPDTAMGTDRLVAERVADDEADATQVRFGGRVQPSEQGALGVTKVERAAAVLE